MWADFPPFLIMQIISFTEEEKLVVRNEAIRRQSLNESRNIRGRNGGPEKGSQAQMLHHYGAAGEMAVAKMLNLKEFLYLEKSPVKGSYDLPYKIDVKTAMRHTDSLIVQLDDTGDKNYWLVTIANKEVRIHGWLDHASCAQDRFIRDPLGGRPAYFIPQKQLNAVDSFFDEMARIDRASA